MADEEKRIVIYCADGQEYKRKPKFPYGAVVVLVLLVAAGGVVFEQSLLAKKAPAEPVGNIREAGISESWQETPRMVSPPPCAPPNLVIYIRDDHPWSISFAEHGYMDRHNALAVTDRSTRTIWIDETIKPEQVKETILHELLHVSYSRSVWPPEHLTQENDFVAPASPVLFSILRDNPHLAQWILQ